MNPDASLTFLPALRQPNRIFLLGVDVMDVITF
jgi:hypothetical protein